jgi:hypothetical protein
MITHNFDPLSDLSFGLHLQLVHLFSPTAGVSVVSDYWKCGDFHDLAVRVVPPWRGTGRWIVITKIILSTNTEN